ncbi:tyrosine-type recombinase/integrase [Arthrobacter sp. H35-D1]|uniref:tyrosine-type recombinase/integrase n=1 Tax=Arthrobacter sp. H35-D1 TaxID=3046202 RepID=UPI0024B87B2A|nr:tyrosine-type recombinase/integrase [Arthrobacter sp. H35-D1]MDJ0314198.1 tyrosine-type recombinase/integrase [Arthrobacter sp. H35-D1]
MQQFLDLSNLRQVLPLDSGIAALHPDEAVYESMLGSWEQQQRSRSLTDATINERTTVVRHFGEYAGSYPWKWQASDLDDYSSFMRSKNLAVSTIRHRQGILQVFCSYLVSPDYDWVEICETKFGDTPSQICLPWNTTKHLVDNEGHPGRRALTLDEIETLFNYADSRVEAAVRNGRKGALAALRDAQMFKTAYSFGLRRAELRGLDIQDLHGNARVPQWGQYAAIHVRWGKASKGSAPKRRTVLLVPELAWWIDGMTQWIEEDRSLFIPGSLAALWPTERKTRVSLEYIDRRFTALRREAGLDPALSLHCLRHSYVTHLIEYGYADRFVQEQVGHQHSSTTAIYTSVSGDFKNRILADALHRFNDLEKS